MSATANRKYRLQQDNDFLKKINYIWAGGIF